MSTAIPLELDSCPFWTAVYFCRHVGARLGGSPGCCEPASARRQHRRGGGADSARMSTTTSPPATDTTPTPTTLPTPVRGRRSRTAAVVAVLGAALAASTGFDGPAPWAPVRGLVALVL